MADPNIWSTITAGGVAALTTTGVTTMFFKGDRIVLRRELDTEKERTKEANSRTAILETANERLQDELKEQYRANTELVREVLDKVDYLQSLAGLAVRDRRGNAR